MLGDPATMADDETEARPPGHLTLAREASRPLIESFRASHGPALLVFAVVACAVLYLTGGDVMRMIAGGLVTGSAGWALFKQEMFRRWTAMDTISQRVLHYVAMFENADSEIAAVVRGCVDGLREAATQGGAEGLLRHTDSGLANAVRLIFARRRDTARGLLHLRALAHGQVLPDLHFAEWLNSRLRVAAVGDYGDVWLSQYLDASRLEVAGTIAETCRLLLEAAGEADILCDHAHTSKALMKHVRRELERALGEAIAPTGEAPEALGL